MNVAARFPEMSRERRDLKLSQLEDSSGVTKLIGILFRLVWIPCKISSMVHSSLSFPSGSCRSYDNTRELYI